MAIFSDVEWSAADSSLQQSPHLKRQSTLLLCLTFKINLNNLSVIFMDIPFAVSAACGKLEPVNQADFGLSFAPDFHLYPEMRLGLNFLKPILAHKQAQN